MKSKTDLYMIHGDTLEFKISIKGSNSQEYTLLDGDSLWFVVKRDYKDETPLVYITQSDKHFKVDFSEINIPIGIYKYEVGIVFGDGGERTLISDSILKISKKLKDHSYDE